jgi:hypothetical protein
MDEVVNHYQLDAMVEIHKILKNLTDFEAYIVLRKLLSAYERN